MKLFWIPPQEPSKEVSWNFTLGSAVDYYFIYGLTIDEQNEGYCKITGAAPMMPKWAYGLFHSNAVAKNNSLPVPQKEIEDYVKGYRDRKIPVDVIVQDFYYWPEGMWGSHLWRPDTHPDPKGMINFIHEHNMHIMLTVWPIFQDQNSSGLTNTNFTEMNNAGNLLILYDKDKFSWYNPWKNAARKMYWEQIRQYLYSLGIDAWWLDSSEGPNQHLVVNDWWRETTIGETKALQYANEYPLMTSQAVYEGQRSTDPDKRVFILTRCAFAGQQRYASAVWSGDIGVDFWTLKHQIPEGLNFTLSGIPYWTTDIGGFGGGFDHYKDYNGRDQNDTVYRETFIRWFQFGSFCPIFRIHGATGHTAVYEYGEKAEKILT
jgi:alpha-D-xyloside xylohydrolase